MAKLYNFKHIVERFGTNSMDSLKQLNPTPVRFAKDRAHTQWDNYILATPEVDAWVQQQNVFNYLANVKRVKPTHRKINPRQGKEAQ